MKRQISARLELMRDPSNWRETLAFLLHKLAYKIDQRLFVMIELTTDPPISDQKRNECIKQGLYHARHLALSEARCAVIDEHMANCFPELHDEGGQ